MTEETVKPDDNLLKPWQFKKGYDPRRCYAMEISPAYCAVILQRFHDAFPDVKIEKMK